MAYDTPQYDPYGSPWVESAAQPQPEPTPTGPAAPPAGLRQAGWYPQGGQWVPYYRAADGKYYTQQGDAYTSTGTMPPAGFVDGANKPTWPTTESGPPDPAPAPSMGGGGGGGAGTAIDPSYLEPWTETFNAPAGSQLPTWKPPAEFSYADFKPLTSQDLLKDPGYLWRENRIVDRVQNSAAAKGLLGSSGTIYDIANSVGDFASQEYGAASDRHWDQWRGGFDNSLRAYNTNYNTAEDTHNYGTSRARDIYNRAWEEYNNRRQTFWTNQDNAVNRIHRIGSLGQG